jgi:hypothetical protein
MLNLILLEHEHIMLQFMFVDHIHKLLKYLLYL